VTRQINIESIARELKHTFPEILFAFLYGSSRDGTLMPGSDIDLAIYFEEKASKTDLIPRIIELIESHHSSITCDLTILNTANPLIAFEALRGKLLFIRDEYVEVYADFYSLTCRLSEDQKWFMKKQLEYRGYDVQWDY
jgi:predicted nucleotidyltransferase